jgi:DNA/RNA endonuclease YhcR with UshA esterase domain
MNIGTKLPVALSVLTLMGVCASAHHSLAMYDMTHPVTVTGVVTRVEWADPHVHLYLNVKDSNGHVEEWAIEMDRPGFLESKGWTRTRVKPGDSITCTGGPAKSGVKTMRCTTVELQNGDKLRS